MKPVLSPFPGFDRIPTSSASEPPLPLTKSPWPRPSSLPPPPSMPSSHSSPSSKRGRQQLSKNRTTEQEEERKRRKGLVRLPGMHDLSNSRNGRSASSPQYESPPGGSVVPLPALSSSSQSYLDTNTMKNKKMKKKEKRGRENAAAAAITADRPKKKDSEYPRPSFIFSENIGMLGLTLSLRKCLRVE
jgi:hypothetical protein